VCLPLNPSGRSEDRLRPFVKGTGPLLRSDTCVDNVLRVDVRPTGGKVSEEPGHPRAGNINVAGTARRQELTPLATVAMMEAADHGRLDDLAFVKALHPSWLRGVLRQGEVCAGPVVVDEVLAQEAAQMGFVQHHDVVEAFAAEGADERST
jgi:hypothetical protein